MKTICEIVICACRAAPSWYEIVLTGVVSALAANKLYKLSTTKRGSDT